MVCTFFGHRDCYDLESGTLTFAIERLIQKGVDTFYVGHQGEFDRKALACLQRVKAFYPQISFTVVLAYLPTKPLGYDPYSDCSIYPEGIETGPPKFAIERRNRWMLAQADYCLCYVNRPWGGAYKFAKQAKRKGLTVVNLGRAAL